MKTKILLFMLACALCGHADEITFKLADELLTEKRHAQAATEFRRFAMQTDDPTEEASAYLYAGFTYLQDEQAQAALEMIDRAEEADSSDSLLSHRNLLSAEATRRTDDLAGSVYYYDLLIETAQSSALKAFALRRAATAELLQNQTEAARQRLQHNPAELNTLNTYLDGKDKNPKTGALWGIIPGAGYFYSGEYANGFRNLILNGVFMFAMAHTADKDQWGAFTAISFFELTWYTGSIYGGIDAAHRYNRNRLDQTLAEIEGPGTLRPDESVVPLFKLKVQF